MIGYSLCSLVVALQVSEVSPPHMEVGCLLGLGTAHLAFHTGPMSEHGSSGLVASTFYPLSSVPGPQNEYFYK